METAVDYDYYEGALEIPHTNGWTSANAAYTTIGATPDKNPGGCWNTSPNYNRWFKFQATGPMARVTVKRGGVFGTIARINAAIWQANGTTQVACKIYVNDFDEVVIQTLSLVPGNWYYLSVDNNYSGYRGTFSLQMNTTVDYDYYEGAFEITNPSSWCSTNAQFSTIGATPDKNPGSCWNTSPNYNRWFKFQATGSGMISIQILRGGSYGTVLGLNAALWESNGTTQVLCTRYVNVGDNLVLQKSGLTVGNWYYFSVDNYYSGYRGTFSVCINDGSINWTGNVSSNWNTPGNWSSGTIPDQFTNVAISSGAPNYPVITGQLAVGANFGYECCKSLTINNGASLTLNGWGQINVWGNIVVNTGGTLMVRKMVDGYGGKLYITGGNVSVADFAALNQGAGYMNSGTFTLNDFTYYASSTWYASGGTIYINAPAGTDANFDALGTLNIFNLEITSASKVIYTGTTNVNGNFTIQPKGKFDLSTGTLNIAGNTYFKADATGQGQFIDHAPINVTGTSTVEQYLISERWHLVSAPISNAQIGVYYNLYLKEFIEPTNTWNYLSLPLTIPMPATKGFSAWASNALTGTTTVSYTGSLNLGNNYPLNTLNYTPGSPGIGWNLIGNPYPAPLQWNSSWTKSNVSEWACIHNNGHDECYNAATQTGWPNAGDMANGIIPSTQGFWVRATSASASVTIPQSQRMFSDQAFYKDAEVMVNESIRLRVDGNDDYDAVLVQFIPGSTEGYDPVFDLEKRWGYDEAPQLFTIMGEYEYLSVNALPEITENLIVPIGLKVGAEGEYTITSSEFKNFKAGVSVTLEDMLTNTFTNLTLNEGYTFTASPMDANHRFNLHFKSAAFGSEENGSYGINVYSADNTIYVQIPEYTVADVTIYDLMGREIFRDETIGDSMSKIQIETETGYYIVKVRTNEASVAKKVFLK